MVRTYAYNPSCQGNFFGSASTPSLYSPPARNNQEVQLNDVEVVPVRQKTPPPERCTCNALSQPFYTPFHSPYVDPVGSIIGLRVLYLEGKLCYVPVEPQLNYIINQQFGNGFCIQHMANRSLPPKDDMRSISHYESYKENRMEMPTHHQTSGGPRQERQEQYAAASHNMPSTSSTAVRTEAHQTEMVVNIFSFIIHFYTAYIRSKASL
ncbi:hypothetical protein Y032_0657g1241 [Ancylostoma ceylanicum]|uniref:Uncharacterized protein n=1 Tax=Ancylostoma ceylanicum TaxID=53326 RepID=A0A016WIC4_9BILA|nr:hypothetical protein Y032_0657g1241 [Ancylostoma ceylanicum]